MISNILAEMRKLGIKSISTSDVLFKDFESMKRYVNGNHVEYKTYLLFGADISGHSAAFGVITTRYNDNVTLQVFTDYMTVETEVFKNVTKVDTELEVILDPVKMREAIDFIVKNLEEENERARDS